MNRENNFYHPDERSFRPWGKIKNEILKNFLPIYVSSMLKRRKVPLLIDAYAGPGEYRDKSLGSPIIMLKTIHEAFLKIRRIDDFKKVIFLFFELDKNYLDSLKIKIDEFIKINPELNEVEIIPFQADSKGELQDLAKFLETKSLNISPFLYLDPWGLTGVCNDILFPFLSLREKGIEVEILLRFPPTDVYRFLRNSRLGADWIRNILGDIELSELEIAGERNLDILRRYLNSIKNRYYDNFQRNLYFVAVDVEAKPPYYMVFFTESKFGCFSMGNSMIKALQKYAKNCSRLFGPELIEYYNPKKDLVIRIFKDYKKSKPTISINELMAEYYQRNLFPIFFHKPRGSNIKSMREVLRELIEEGTIQKIEGKLSNPHSLLYL